MRIVVTSTSHIDTLSLHHSIVNDINRHSLFNEQTQAHANRDPRSSRSKGHPERPLAPRLRAFTRGIPAPSPHSRLAQIRRSRLASRFALLSPVSVVVSRSRRGCCICAHAVADVVVPSDKFRPRRRTTRKAEVSRRRTDFRWEGDVGPTTLTWWSGCSTKWRKIG
jgi:hypothetical protein